MKRLSWVLYLLLVLVVKAHGDPFLSGPASITAAGSRHPGIAADVHLYPNLVLSVDSARGHNNVGVKAGVLGLHLNGRTSDVVTTVSLEGRAGSNSLARVHVSQTGYRIGSLDLEWGAFGGTDFGAWGKALLLDHVEFCVGKYDSIGSLGGVYYLVTKSNRAGVAYSELLGAYASYTHTFRWKR